MPEQAAEVSTVRRGDVGVARVLETGRARGEHAGYQCVVLERGEVQAMHWAGQARPASPMTETTLMPWLCMVKPVASIMVFRLHEQGLLSIDQPVSTVVPEFAGEGKERLTFADLLAHRFSYVPEEPADDFLVRSNESVLAEICRVPVASTPRYSSDASSFVVGAAVERLLGLPFGEAARRDVFLPLGMDDSWLGIPPAVLDRYGSGRICGLFAPDPRSSEHSVAAELGVSFHADLSDVERGLLQRSLPGSGGMGPALDLARLYDFLLSGRSRGPAPISPASRATITTAEPGRRDMCGGLTAMGTFVDQFRWTFTTGSFGHLAARSGAVVADPEVDVVVAFLPNGFLPSVAARVRQRRVMRAAVRELPVRPTGVPAHRGRR